MAESKGSAVFRAHPRGVLLLSAVEMWERFSYYGMAALLVLLLSTSPSVSGFGWSEPDALRLYGLYTALIFVSPVVGGWLATTRLGERRAIVIGGMLIIAGHLLIGAPAYGPWIIGHFTGVPVESMLREAGIVLGGLTLPEADREILLARLAERGLEEGIGALTLAWHVKGWSIFTALALIIGGTGLLKAPISSLVGKLYEPGDPRREAGYTLFMVGIWLGALGADVFVGAIGERAGWHVGLATAGAGMAIGLVLYLLGQERLLGDLGKTPELEQAHAGNLSFDPQERRRLLGLLIMGVYSVLFSVAYYQQGGVLHLLIYEHGDRNLWGFVIPATWLMMVTTLSFVVLAPLAELAYSGLGKRGIVVDVVVKQSLGIGALATAYCILWFALRAFDATQGERIHLGWIVVAYVLFAIGDVCIWPPQISAVSRYAPQRCQSVMIGAWYIAIGIGTWLAAMAGAVSYAYGLSRLLGSLFILCTIAALSLVALRPLINRLLAGRAEPCAAPLS